MRTLLIDKRGAAKALSISVRGIERLIAGRELPAVRVRGQVRIPIKALVQLASGKESETCGDEGKRTARGDKQKKAPVDSHATSGVQESKL
jgi:excisionase family DNA binding protein